MENNTPQKVFRLTPESLSDEIKMCTTLPQYHVLICVDSSQSKTDLVNSIGSLLFERPEDTMAIRARIGGARITRNLWNDEAYIEFRNRSQILFCTNLDMNKYAGQNIQSILVYNKIQYVEAAMEYAKTIVEPYKAPSDYDLIDDLLFNNTEYIRPIKRREIDTSAMDNFLEEI